MHLRSSDFACRTLRSGTTDLAIETCASRSTYVSREPVPQFLMSRIQHTLVLTCESLRRCGGDGGPNASLESARTSQSKTQERVHELQERSPIKHTTKGILQCSTSDDAYMQRSAAYTQTRARGCMCAQQARIDWPSLSAIDPRYGHHIPRCEPIDPA